MGWFMWTWTTSEKERENGFRKKIDFIGIKNVIESNGDCLRDDA